MKILIFTLFNLIHPVLKNSFFPRQSVSGTICLAQKRSKRYVFMAVRSIIHIHYNERI